MYVIQPVRALPGLSAYNRYGEWGENNDIGNACMMKTKILVRKACDFLTGRDDENMGR